VLKLTHTHAYTGWAKKVSLVIITMSAKIHNFWHVFTIGNLQIQDI